ncbi:MAG TPA: hypothetical protein VLN47_03650 [Clostridiaceae bacterium]|nr:hypothetical protein [Clostridiaceae bacterium]
MKSLSLCIDIDGTVTEPYYWLERANAYFGSSLLPEHVTQYEIHKLLGVEPEVYLDFYEHNGIYLHSEAEIRLGAREVISSLYDNHIIHFVTAREEKMTDVSVQWLNRHQIPMDSITHLGSHHKVEKAVELQADLFIEDSLENALELAASGFHVLLIDCTYNKGLLPHNVLRVSNWFQIERFIDVRARQIAGNLKFAI